MNNLEQFNWIFTITWQEALISLAIFLIFFIARKLFSKFFLKLIARLSKLSKTQMDDAIAGAFYKPVTFILLFAGIYFALLYLPLPHAWKSIVSLIFKSLTVFSIGWGFYIFSGAIGIFFNRMGNRYELQFNTIVIPFLSKIVKFIIAVFTLSIILEQWNFHVTGLITGLGIGGLAVAMAAKDTLSNLFGGLVIITDAPFTIGDIIQMGSIQGVVEDINFRSTRIRTFDLALVTVPNSTLANSPITNISRMDRRRIYFNLSLDIETTNEQIKRSLGRIRQTLATDSEVYPDKKYVYLDKITSSSKNLMIDFFIKTMDFEEWLKAKEHYNYIVLDILQKEQVKLAAPRSVIITTNDDGKKFEDDQAAATEERLPSRD
ncbi:mechanosensitive ion channel family protein [Sporolactobacillus inulinus]|uniref:mechanosensitive ion channel family protein n=1 Tax=Sporolactobacillus inulinus TaxID=2078 RepID=UPI0035A246AD